MAPPNKKVKKEVGHEEKAGSLRIAAENKLTRTPETSTELKGQNPEQLIHELQVHQIELEMKEEELRRIQHELEKSRYQYINLYEFAPVGYLSLNDKRLVTKANLTAATLLGIERNKIINRGFSVFIAPEHQTTWLRYFQALSLQGEKSVINLTIRREDSTTFPGRLEGTRIGFDDSSFVIHMTISDISDIVAVQEDLRTSHSRLESAMETGNLAWWEMDCATGNVSFNERKARMLGYPAEQFSHYSDFTTLLHPDDYEPTMQAMRDHLSGVKKNYETDYRIRTIDGDYRWFHDTGGISAYDQDGVPLRVTGLVMDITERKRADTMLRESEERYRTLFERMDEGFCVIEMLHAPDGKAVDYRFVEINPAFEKQTGLSQALGKTIRQMVPNHEAHWFEIYGNVARTGEAIRFDNPAAAMHRYYDVFAFRVGGDGSQKVGFLFKDISERKRAEDMREHLLHDLSQKNAELEQFTYTVSHDLKSPLITIKGFLGYLEKDALAGDTKQLHEDIARIHTATSKMEKFMGALLELSRIGRIINPPVSVPLAFLIQDAVEALDAQIRERGVTLLIPDDLPEVYGDRVRLQQVMTNLIENAVKFMGSQEEPRIGVNAYRKDGEVIVSVEDNGVGIAPENLDKVFSVFTRLDPSIPGSGIGLALVRRIIEVHGGKIRVVSEGAGMGASFCFTLPGVPVYAETPIHPDTGIE